MAQFRTSWQKLPENFRTAMGDCLRLLTLQEVHVHNFDFPLSMLDGHANINCFSLYGPPQVADRPNNTYPQLKSLSFGYVEHLDFSSTWAKQRIVELQSLACDYFESMISEFLEICSDTLDDLDLNLECGGCESSLRFYDLHNVELNIPDRRKCGEMPSINHFSLPRLQHLTIRANVHEGPRDPQGISRDVSTLPAAV